MYYLAFMIVIFEIYLTKVCLMWYNGRMVEVSEMGNSKIIGGGEMGKVQKIYVANCIEHGERFTSMFKSSESDPKRLYEIGQEMASGWGAECISVTAYRPKRIVVIRDVKTGKVITTTEKKWENWQVKEQSFVTIVDKRNGKRIQTSRAKLINWLSRNYSGDITKSNYTIDEAAPRPAPRYEFVRYEQEVLKDVWDADKSEAENLKDFDHAHTK